MRIVLEGVDATGKTTLGQHLARELNYRYQPSEGPPRHTGEMAARIARYQRMEDTVFDRHPIVSQTIYGVMRPNPDEDQPTPLDIAEFYSRRCPFFIYCRPSPNSKIRHTIKDYDTKEHLALIEKNQQKILDLYDRWALSNARLVYRIGESFNPILAMIRKELEDRD